MQEVLRLSIESDTDRLFSTSVRHNPFTDMHTHDFYEITIVTDGNVVHHINGTVGTLPSGTVIFLRPQDTHCFTRPETGSGKYINLPFTPDTLRELLAYTDSGLDISYYHDADMPPMLHLSAADTQLIEKKVDELNALPANDLLRKKAYFRLLIADLFFRILQSSFAPKIYQPLWFNDLLQKIGEPENFSQGLDCLESISGKSIAYISRVFKKNLQVTPTEYINDLRLNYCAGKLAYTDAPIMEIAMDAGFNNLSHFYHLFREKFHMSPKQYRLTNLLAL